MKKLFLAIAALALILSFSVSTEAQYPYAYRIAPVTALPALCNPNNGSIVALTVGAAPLSPAFYECTATNTWTRLLLNGGTSLVTGTVTGFTIQRTDAGHVHLTLIDTAGTADFGIGAAGAPHIDSAPAANINFRAAGVDVWSILPDGRLRAATTILQAALAGLAAPQTGDLIWCTDCTVAAPCAGGGTGALAKYNGAAWNCN